MPVKVIELQDIDEPQENDERDDEKTEAHAETTTGFFGDTGGGLSNLKDFFNKKQRDQ